MPKYRNSFCIYTKVCTCMILSITATDVCFNVSLLSIAEDQGMVIFTPNRNHPVSIDVTIRVKSSDITTNGEATVTA